MSLTSPCGGQHKGTYLNEEVLEELLVCVLVVVHLRPDLLSQLGAQLLDELVDLAHALDPREVLGLGLLNLHPHFLVGQLVLEVFLDFLLLGGYVVVLLGGVLVVLRLLDPGYLFNAVLVDEGHHRIKYLICLHLVHLVFIIN